MAPRLGRLFGIVLILFFIIGPVVLAFHQQSQRRNFRIVREGVLYRAGQMTLPALKRIVHDYGIRTVITLRDAHVPGEPPPAPDEEEFCAGMDIQYVRLPLRSWSGPASEAPVEENVRRFRALLADPANHPVLVHCFRGVHRSGAYCAIYRMEFEHWPNDRAIAELKACGYDNLDGEEDILGYLERYQPTWRASEETAAEKKHPR